MGHPPEEEYECDSMSIDIVDIIGGLPLAIEVTASHLYEKKGKIQIWQETLDRLRKKTRKWGQRSIQCKVWLSR